MENSDIDGFYADIELTEKEKSYALYLARQAKSDQLEKERVIESRRRAEAAMHIQWTSDELKQYIQHRAVKEFGFSANDGADGKPVFRIDQDNESVIDALCLYFTNDPKFETLQEGWKLDKGICLFGNVGLGKSLLMRLFGRNKRQCFDVISCRKVGSLYAEDGDHAIVSFSGVRNCAFMDATVFYQKQLGYCFDDMGTEETKSFFGNKTNVMGEILLNRYDKKFEYGWHFTHVTTNLTADEIEQHYGTRVRSRFREIFNQIHLTGHDRRH